MSGIESMGYSTSTTGPITRATRPVAPPDPVSLVSSTVAVMVFSSVSRTGPLLGLCLGVGQRIHAADDLADLLGDAGLTGLVGHPGVLLDELVRVVGRRLHRLLPGGELGGRRLQQRVEDPALDVLRQQP